MALSDANPIRYAITTLVVIGVGYHGMSKYVSKRSI